MDTDKKRYICTQIKWLDHEGCKHIGSLIKTYGLESIIKENIDALRIDLDKLPEVLINEIYEYIKDFIQKLEK